jgi:lipopolysaccharide/colanic/teichoic acid biosynthesis glycosyltransferase
MTRTLARALDLAVAGLLAVLTAPALALLGLEVLIASGPPVLHREMRLGRFGRHFELIKLRTLRAVPENACSIAIEGDSRITGIGGWLRRSRLDELPQLYLVLTGEMSLVGPRPLKPEHAACLPPELLAALLSVRPGLTGPAAIAFLADDDVLGERPEARDPARIESLYLRKLLPAKARLDAAYVAHRTLGSDILVLFRTLRALVMPSLRAASRARVENLLGS